MAATFHSTCPRTRVKAISPEIEPSTVSRDLVAELGDVLAVPRAESVACPCCGDPMHPDQIVCWPCYRSTDRLTPGRHADPTFAGMTFTVSAANVERWEAERDARREGGAA